MVLACGGRAQKADPNDEDASGASAGSSGDTPSGRGGTSAGVGGAAGAAGAGATAGVVVPVFGGAGEDEGANVPDAPPPGVEIGTLACPQGTTTQYQAPLPQVDQGFRGEIDGTPIELPLGAPNYGSLTLGGGCPRANIWTVEFIFDGALEGDQFTLYLDPAEGCVQQGWYVPKGEDAQATEIEAALHLWQEGEHGSDMARFVYGTLVMRSKALDGGASHELRGQVSLYLPTYVCIG
jgi:hypothetical protein